MTIQEKQKTICSDICKCSCLQSGQHFMYMIGMGAAIFTGEYDIAQIMLKTGFGIVGF